LQVLFVFADNQSSPGRTAAEFAKAYFACDEAGMMDRLCAESLVVDDINMVKQYVYEKSREAQARGFELGVYTRQKVAHLRTETLESEHDGAVVRISGEVRQPMRSFFVGEDVSRHVEAELKLIREDGRWKVCDMPFALDEV
ncbi:MAG: hypothetical protein ACLFRG_22395, partial [Desulfococcaceae bacterium]